jgi:hypothetical protein
MASALGLAERQYCRHAQHKHHGRKGMAKRPKSKRRPVNGTVEQRVFLSASIPLPSRNATYFNTADIVAIRDAVRALTIVVIEQKAQLVFGGHPAISPMIRLQIARNRKSGHARLDASEHFIFLFDALHSADENAAIKRPAQHRLSHTDKAFLSIAVHCIGQYDSLKSSATTGFRTSSQPSALWTFPCLLLFRFALTLIGLRKLASDHVIPIRPSFGACGDLWWRLLLWSQRGGSEQVFGKRNLLTLRIGES